MNELSKVQENLQVNWHTFANHKPIYSVTVHGPWCDWCSKPWPCMEFMSTLAWVQRDTGPSEAEIQTAVDSIRRTA